MDIFYSASLFPLSDVTMHPYLAPQYIVSKFNTGMYIIMQDVVMLCMSCVMLRKQHIYSFLYPFCIIHIEQWYRLAIYRGRI